MQKIAIRGTARKTAKAARQEAREQARGHIEYLLPKVREVLLLVETSCGTGICHMGLTPTERTTWETRRALCATASAALETAGKALAGVIALDRMADGRTC